MVAELGKFYDPMSPLGSTGGGGGTGGGGTTTGLPTRALIGGVARSFAQAQSSSFNTVIDGFALSDYSWADLQPLNGSNLDSGAVNNIIAALDYAAAHVGVSGNPMKVRLRIECGILIPSWLKTQVGQQNHYIRQGSGLDTSTPDPLTPGYYLFGKISFYWEQAFRDAYKNLHALLAPHIGNHPALAEVCYTGIETEFPEPELRQFGSQSNLNATVANGWTPALDIATFDQGWSDLYDIWTPYGVAIHETFNPHDTCPNVAANPLKHKSDTDLTLNTMSRFASAAGSMAVMGNYSLKDPEGARGDDYVTLIEQLKTYGQDPTTPRLIAFQTANSDKIIAGGGTIVGTIELAIALGASSVELPVARPGSTQVTPTQMIAYTAQMAANAAGKWSTTGGGGGGGGGGGTGTTPNIMLVMMENEPLNITNSATWPNASSLAATYAYKTQFYGMAHPSQPNYLGIVSGSFQGVSDDSHQSGLTGRTFFDQLSDAGVPWKVYAEGLPTSDISSNTPTFNGGTNYMARHNIIGAFANYEPTSPKVVNAGSTSAIGTATWPALINDLNSTNHSNFIYFAPTPANQGHSGYPTSGPWTGSASDADNFINKFVNAVQATQWYRDGGSILFVWDEGSGGDSSSGFSTTPFTGSNGGGITNFLVVSEQARSVGAVSGLMNGYGLLKDFQDAYGITERLGNSGGSWGSAAQLYSPATSGGGGGGGGGGNGWETPDTTTITSHVAPFIIAGYLFADGGGQFDGSGTLTITGGTTLALTEKANTDGSHGDLTSRFLAAGVALGGHLVGWTALANNREKVQMTGLTWPGSSDLHLNVAMPWITAGDGPQKRAFMAALIEVEGSQSGKIQDDPVQAHIQITKDIIESDECYNIATNIHSGSVFSLWMTNYPADNVKIDAFPFVQWGRVPGGQP